MTKTIKAGHVSFDIWQSIYRDGINVKLDASAKPACEKSAAIVKAAAAGANPIYGVNTGFGKLARIQISVEDTAKLQRNLILSHCCGGGGTYAGTDCALDDGAEN